MKDTIAQAIKDIKYVMTLTADQEKYIGIVLTETYHHGKWEGLEKGFEICHGSIKESMTEEQAIEHAKTSTDVISNESTIL